MTQQQRPKRQMSAELHSGYQGRLNILEMRLESRLDRSRKVYVGNGPQQLSLQLIKQLQSRRKEAGRCTQGIQHLGQGEHMAE